MPKILIDLEKIKHNTKEIVKLAKKSNLNIAGVTKAVCGDLKIAKKMVEGGVKYLADSRLINLKNLQKKIKNIPLILLRSPTFSEINQTIKCADISLQSEIEIIEKISKISLKHKKKHKIILMIEMGDRREGILEKDIYNFMSKIIKFKGIQIYGIGMNLSCYGGVIPTKEKVLKLSSIANDLEKKYKIKLKIISSGNSSSINLLTPPFKTKANNLRIGEAILLGNETVNRNPIKNCYSDANYQIAIRDDFRTKRKTFHSRRRNRFRCFW